MAAAAPAQPATDLSRQLEVLSVRQGVDQGRRHQGRASLLYTFQQAADLDAETIHRIGVEGFDQLCELDARFQAHRRTLFGPAAQAPDRGSATAETNARLDAAVAGFCDLLSSCFLLAPAFQALEWLVRKFRVHEHNVDALMAAALPYHETQQFVRLVQILKLEPRGRWAFLAPMQASGAPAPRAALVQRCVTDRSLLRFVCDTAQRQAEPRLAGRVVLPFYAVLVCEYLAALKRVDEQLLTFLLPYLLAGLSSGVVPDFRAASYMIAGQLASRATFSADLVNVLVAEVCRTASPALLGPATALLAHLANTQPHLTALPPTPFKRLAKVPGLVDELAALAGRGCRLAPLAALLAAAAAGALPAHEALLQDLLARLPMGPAARVLADALLAQAAAAPADEEAEAAAGAEAGGGEARSALLRLLRTLDARFPAELDSAVDAALPPPPAAAAAGSEPGAGEAAEAAAAAAAAQARRAAVLAALQQAFEGTARCPLPEAGTTVLLAAEAPAASVRLLAVQRLDALLSAAPGEAGGAAGAALLRRLGDDSAAVAQAALSAPSLLSLPPVALLEGLAGCLLAAMRKAAERATRKAERAEARGVVRKALKLAAGPLLEAAPALLPRVLPLLLACLPVAPGCGPRVAETAAKAAGRVAHPLLAELDGGALLAGAGAEGADGVARPASPRGRRAGRKGAGGAAAHAAASAAGAARRAERDGRHNAAVVAALAAAASADGEASAALAALLAAAPGDPAAAAAEPLLLLAARAAVGGGGAGAAALAGALARSLAAPPAAAAAGPAAAELPAECFDEGGAPTAPLLAQLAAGTLALPPLRSALALAALRAAPWADLAPGGSTAALLPLARALCRQRWRAAATALSARAAAAGQPAAELWALLFAAPPEDEAADVAAAAAEFAAAALGAGGRKAGATASPSLLARCLAALAHPAAAVRRHAAAAAAAAAAGGAAAPLARALAANAAAIEADGEAAEQLLQLLLGAEQQPAAALAAQPLPASEAAALGGALLAAAAGEAAAAGGARGGPAAPVAAHAARWLLGALASWAPAPDALRVAAAALAGAARMRAAPAGGAEAREREALLAAAAAGFSGARLRQLLAAEGEAGAAPLLDAWCGLLAPGGGAGAAEARLAALRGLDAACYEALPAATRGRCLRLLLAAASEGGDAACRLAARDALAALPLGAAELAPLLSLAPGGGAEADGDVAMAEAEEAAADGAAEGGGSGAEDEQLRQLEAAAAAAEAAAAATSPRSRRGREAAAAREAAAEAAAARRAQLAAAARARARGRAAGAPEGGAAPAQRRPHAGCTAALELLLWRDDVPQAEQLVPTVQDVLRQLLDQLPAAAAAQPGGGSDGDEEQPAAADAGAGGSLLLPPAEALYLTQLCLAALLALARRARAVPPQPPAPGKPSPGRGRGRKAAAPPAPPPATLDVALAVRAAAVAPDGAARTAALELIAELAARDPEAALGHVLEVAAVVGAAAALQEDAESERVAAQVLREIVPAWVAAGRSPAQLAAAVVAALPAASPHRRRPLAAALAAALPPVEGLCCVAALLLERGAAAGAARRGGEESAAAAEESEWAPELAADLMDEAPLLLQAQACAALLDHAMEAARGQPWQPLPLLAVAFVTRQLERRAGGASAASGAELAAAHGALLRCALAQLQALGGGARGGARGAPEPLARAAAAGCYRLLRALRDRTPPAAFLSALAELAAATRSDRLRRKALQLLAVAARDFAAEPPADAAEAAATADAALAACAPAAALAAPAPGGGAAPGEPTSALARQAALGVLATVAAAYGDRGLDTLLASLPATLDAARDASAAVRCSALGAAAALCAALGTRLVPALPPTVAAVAAAVSAGAAAVAAAAPATARPQAAAPGSSDSGSGSDGEGEGGRGGRGGRDGPGEAAALELAAGLAALAALVESVGAFLAPHLPELLAVLLHPAVLQCRAARCADVAAAVRRALAATVPTRLLLPPLLAHLDAAAEAGPDSVVALLGLLGAAVRAMDSAALSSHLDALSTALLRALDLRRRRPTALADASGGLDRAEAAAVGCLAPLTLRLTEAQFRPLFLRLLEWSQAVPAGDSALPAPTGQLLRSVALFGVVNALAEQLRGVFVPYFPLLLDACVAHLAEAGAAAAGRKPGKKRRKSGDAGGGAAPDDHPLHAEHAWRLRLRVMRALHRCFLYDAGAGGAPRFLDDARFQRLLPPLVAQLGASPPPGLAAVLQADADADGAASLESALRLGADADAPASTGAGAVAPADAGAAALDAFGRAAVAALAQLAVAAGGDAQWKQLNHAVLMATRDAEPRARLAALEAAAQLAGRLGEEYLALLPETLPFLAELLEDPEQPVEARAAALLRRLEALAGEPLGQYLR